MPDRWVRLVIIPMLTVMMATGSLGVAVRPVHAAAGERMAVIDEVWDILQAEFYDPLLRGLDASAVKEEYRGRAREVADEGLADLVNDMLGRLGTSHTMILGGNDPRRYQLLGIFSFLVPDGDDPRLIYEGIGMQTVRREGQSFVCCVYDGFPAQKAGILYGDEIISVDGHAWDGLRSFRGKAGQTVSVEVRRRKGESTLRLPVKVEALNGRTMFEDALRASVRRFDVEDVSVGYMHIWNYAGRQFHDIVCQMLLWGDLKDCDAVVLDLRDGWGGAGLEYLNIFREPLAAMSSRGRDGKTETYDGSWRRPVVLLVNERSTSGKEMYAYAFKKHNLGKIVGVRTAGAVLAGTPRILTSGDILYFAVKDVWIDGVRLEGKGVVPDVIVERPLPFAAGMDPQLDAAIHEAARSVHR